MTESTASGDRSWGSLLAWMTVFVVAGTPPVYVIWNAINDLLTGHVVKSRIGLAIPAIAVLAVLLRILARTVARWEERPVGGGAGGDSPERR